MQISGADEGPRAARHHSPSQRHVFTADQLGSRMGVCSARREGIRHECGVGALLTPPLLQRTPARCD